MQTRSVRPIKLENVPYGLKFALGKAIARWVKWKGKEWDEEHQRLLMALLLDKLNALGMFPDRSEEAPQPEQIEAGTWRLFAEVISSFIKWRYAGSSGLLPVRITCELLGYLDDLELCDIPESLPPGKLSFDLTDIRGAADTTYCFSGLDKR